jgi:glycine betaine/proline transport system substrate-binding protein
MRFSVEAPVRSRALLRLASVWGCLAAAAAASAAEVPVCEVDRPVSLAGLDWESNDFHVAVARFILREGYGCAVEAIPGSTLPLLMAMARGDVDITLELWEDNLRDLVEPLRKAGRIEVLGVNYPDSEQGWYVPRYLVEGPSAPAPGLASVSDLPKYKELFRDREEPDKGRFHNGVAGWGAERINTRKLIAYGLDRYFTNVRLSGTGEMEQTIAAAYRMRRPILYYSWSPSWVSGSFDGVRLKEPPFDPGVWAELQTSESPTRATAYPTMRVRTAVNADFGRAAPELRAFVAAYRTEPALVSNALTVMRQTGSADDAARDFLKHRPDVWRPWLPEDVAARVATALP